MAQTLQQRMISYEDSTSSKIISRIPIIIKIDGSSFARTTKKINKPFCHKTMAILNGTMLSLVKQIDGAVFGFQYSDKIIIVVRNDRGENEDPWFSNDIQSMCSSSASKATYEFITKMWEIDSPPNLEGDISFKSKVFGVPNISEVINYIVYSQYSCMQYAINEAVYAIIGKRSLPDGTDLDARKKILDEAGVSLDTFPSAFRQGTAAYVTPKLVRTGQGEVTHHKWMIDFEVPLFVNEKDRERLRTIIKTGSDIFKPERDL
jgi:tRNA(His) 5'-end guanylyltransferase